MAMADARLEILRGMTRNWATSIGMKATQIRGQRL
jgi:hypothetical protein